MTVSPKLLIYGFEAFKHYKKNITAELIKHLPDAPYLEKRILPVRFEAQLFLEPATRTKADYILGLGQCPRGRKIRIERKAHNQKCDCSQNIDQVIDSHGPKHIFGNWLLPTNTQRRYSYDAGRYVCNYSMYQLGQYAQNHAIKYSFLHIPRTYPLKRALKEVEKIIQMIISHAQ